MAEQPGGGAGGRPQQSPARQRPESHRSSSTSASLEGICGSLPSPPTSGVTAVSEPRGKTLGGGCWGRVFPALSLLQMSRWGEPGHLSSFWGRGHQLATSVCPFGHYSCSIGSGCRVFQAVGSVTRYPRIPSLRRTGRRARIELPLTFPPPLYPWELCWTNNSTWNGLPSVGLGLTLPVRAS